MTPERIRSALPWDGPEHEGWALAPHQLFARGLATPFIMLTSNNMDHLVIVCSCLDIPYDPDACLHFRREGMRTPCERI
jgi:hypothetical protein